MAYRDDIAALGASHLYRFDGDANDGIGTADGTLTGFLSGTAICEDAASSGLSNGTGDRITLPSVATINSVAQSRKAVGGWFLTTAVQPPPKRIYGEGEADPVFQIVLAFGNNSMFEVADGAALLQIYGPVLQPNRAYHLCAVFEGNGFANAVRFYVDGVEQLLAEPTDRQPDVATLSARGAGAFGDPISGSGVGGETVGLNAPVNGLFNFWAIWDGVSLADSDIRSILFERGALPGVTITSDTAANMQIALDALAGTVRPNEALNIRVEPVAGGGDFTLTADSIIHDPLASIHVQYTGTDTLTWVNNNGSDAAIGSTPNGGTIDFVTPATLTVEPLAPGTEVRVYEAGTTTELAGVESSGTTFSALLSVPSVDVAVLSLPFQSIRVKAVDLTGGDVTVPISQIPDPQYENP